MGLKSNQWYATEVERMICDWHRDDNMRARSKQRNTTKVEEGYRNRRMEKQLTSKREFVRLVKVSNPERERESDCRWNTQKDEVQNGTLTTNGDELAYDQISGKKRVSHQESAPAPWVTDTHQQCTNYSRKRKLAMSDKQDCGRNIPEGKLQHAVICEIRKNVRWSHQWHMNGVSDWRIDQSRHWMIFRPEQCKTAGKMSSSEATNDEAHWLYTLKITNSCEILK